MKQSSKYRWRSAWLVVLLAACSADPAGDEDVRGELTQALEKGVDPKEPTTPTLDPKSPDEDVVLDFSLRARGGGFVTSADECYGWCNDLSGWCERIRECSEIESGAAAAECRRGCTKLGDRCRDTCVRNFNPITPPLPPPP